MPIRGFLIPTRYVSFPPSIITSSPLPSATAGVPYSTTLNAAGGTLPYAWSQVGLTGGYSLNAATGVISGTDPTAGTINFTATVTDAIGLPSAPTAFSLTVDSVNTFDFYISPTGDDVLGAGTLASPWSITALGTMPNRATTAVKWTTYGGKSVGLIGDQGTYTQGQANGTITTLASLMTYDGGYGP